ncbi:isochorismatase family protein [Chloroflexota bacterium]
MRSWEQIFTETDREVARVFSGGGQKQAYGKNPALLIIDVTDVCVGPNKPILEAIKEVRGGCGEVGWRAISDIQKVLEVCRDNNVPVIYSLPDPKTREICGIRGGKTRATTTKIAFRPHKIIESIAPLDSELVISKVKPSFFFGTPLVTCLRALGIDTLLIVGTATSGCVRATAVDGSSYGYRCFIIEECTFDRFELSHLVNLFDMNLKYVDVVTLEEILEYITRVGQEKKKIIHDQ